MKGTIYKQYTKMGKQTDKPKPLHGSLAFEDGKAFFTTPKTVLGTLKRASVDFIARDGIMLSGVVDIGTRLYYQRWWFVPRTATHAPSRCPVCGDDGIGSERWGGHNPSCPHAKGKARDDAPDRVDERRKV